MSYEQILKLRIADHYQRLVVQGGAPTITDAIHQFLDSHSLKISDDGRLRELEYQVRAELQKRMLELRLGKKT